MPLGVVWTFDHKIELLTLIVGALAAAGGIVAAIFAIKANTNTVRAARAETNRWRADIRPAPTLEFLGGGLAQVRVSNAGGAIQPGYVAAVVGPQLYYCRYFLGAHMATNGTLSMPVLTQLPADKHIAVNDSRAVVHFARDVEGTWWDMLQGGVRMDEAVPDPQSPEFETWCESKWKSALGT